MCLARGCGEMDTEGNCSVGITDDGTCAKTRGIWNKFRWKVDCIRVREKKILFQREQFLVIETVGGIINVQVDNFGDVKIKNTHSKE